MKRIRLLVVWALWLAVTIAPARADHVPSEGKVYLSFKPDARVRTIDVQPGLPFPVYVFVDIGSTSGILGIEGSFAFGPDVEILEIDWGPRGIDLGYQFPLPGGRNFIVGLGNCLPTGEGPFAVGKITAVLLRPARDVGMVVGAPPVGPSVPSSFDGEGPGWADCALSLVLFEEDIGGNGVVINPTTLPVEPSTWGRLKAKYD